MKSDGIAWVYDPEKVSNHLHVDKAKGQFVKVASILLDFAQSDTIYMYKNQNQPFIKNNSCLVFLILLMCSLTGLVTA